MAPKQPCAKYQYVVTSAGPKILPVDEPSAKDEENPADYNAGGYLPVKIGDSFSAHRYTVVRKLGWGHFSTVWLVNDSLTHRHSALKVVKSAFRYTDTARDEIKLLSRVSAFSPSHPGRKHIVSFLDSFSHQGPEAPHICIVFEPLGENLLALIERNKKKGVPRPLVKVIAKQILLGLEYLHDECDLVHTDIKPENILISIPDIETHIYNELSQSPSPTSRRVGVPLPTKSRPGVTIPPDQQRSRRQVQIFDSQPLASPGRSSLRSAMEPSSFGMNARLDSSGSGSVSQNGSYFAQMHLSRTGIGAVSSLSSSAPKVSSCLSTSAPLMDPKLPENISQVSAAKAIPPVATRAVKSPLSTSSSSSSISSALASTTAGSSSMVSTPPTSLSHSLGNVMELMRTGKFETKLRTKPRMPTHESRHPYFDDREGLIIPSKNPKAKTDIEVELSSAMASSWKSRTNLSSSWKEKGASSFVSYKSTSSPNTTSKLRSKGHARSHSGLAGTTFWKDPGTAALAPAILVSTVVGAGGRQENNFDSLNPPFETASSFVTVRPSPTGTPLPMAKNSSSLITGVSNLIDGSSISLEREVVPNPPLFHNISTDTSNSNIQPFSLLTQTAPSRTSATYSPTNRAVIRLSPPQQVSQLSAHMHLHKPSSPARNEPVTDTKGKLKSRISRIVDHPNISSVFGFLPSVTSTGTSISPSAPPPTPVDSPAVSYVNPPSAAYVPPMATNSERIDILPHNFPPLQTPGEKKPISIKIADLGNATPSKKHFTEDIQTRQYRAPEAILGRRDWDTRVDVWSVACVIFELLTAEYLFDPQGQGELFTKDDDHMAQIIELMGDFSLEAKMGGKYSRELFDHTGALRYIRTLKPWPLKRVMIEKYLFTESDSRNLCDFLEPMLAVDMRERLHCRDLLSNKWLEAAEDDDTVSDW